MPIQIDVAKRRTDIAEATFAVAAREGLTSVTLRSVAAEMGASTTTITNYLPTRTDLLVNAVDQMAQEWLDELAAILSDGEGPEELRLLMRAAVSWDAAEHLRCSFWVSLLTAKGRTAEIDRHLEATSASVRAVLRRVVEACGHPDPDAAADHLFLVAQGVFASIVEAPSIWTVPRLIAAADLAVDAVLAGVAV
jgi:AcrR family transcriptional regulator